MFFNHRKYTQTAERGRKKSEKQKDPSFATLVSLGLLATFTPTRWLMRLHKRKIIRNFNYEKPKSPKKQIPIIYIHGFRGGEYTTQKLVDDMTERKNNPGYLKVTADLFGNLTLEGTWTNDEHPIIQLVFKQKVVGLYAICYYLRFSLAFLAKEFNFDKYDTVAHSLGAPSIIKVEIQTAHRKHFPRLDKAALIAGPFDGVMYLGDIPNVNQLTEKSSPTFKTSAYFALLRQKKQFNPHASILNIYGNVLDKTNTDRFISVTSAKSIRYILAPRVKSYQELEIRGPMGEHSMMHDDPLVMETIAHFFKIKDKSHIRKE
ncbi:alpha/beta hydrolase [Lactobacillus sp. PV012]|uniref:alpha/beta hydrolase n=1 Tax=Lactobacillus sp. PV012 TaxID=2594494 RepID=UPI00223EB2BD|nr:alpha/beta hydrolase [Lactobacillus sp. PV012]QNQ81702.1 alpha/beta hydrolase [Lactobacillus sp. PV012]